MEGHKTADIVLNMLLCIVSPSLIFYYLFSKSVPLQAWRGPEFSRTLRSPDYMTTAQDGGNVVSPKHRPPLPQENAPGTHFS